MERKRNLLVKMNLRIKCAILKRVVIFLDLFVWLLGIIGVFFIGAKEINNSLLFFLISGVCYYISYELGYLVQHMIIRLELNGKENAEK